jgi:hypothetical protein
MTNENTIIKDEPRKESKQPQKKKKDNKLNDSYKFGIFCLRAVFAAATGRVIGDANVDHALGDAIASIHHPQDLADQGLAYNVVIRGAAGAWQAVKGDHEWE